jgi:hypothetical protein
MRRQKEGFAVPSDAEWSTYDVILLSSRLGARPNPLANWKHAIFCYWVVGDPEAISALAIDSGRMTGHSETAPVPQSEADVQ